MAIDQTEQVNLAVWVGGDSISMPSPGKDSMAGRGLFGNANDTWNRGWWAVERDGLRSSTSRSNGASWFS